MNLLLKACSLRFSTGQATALLPREGVGHTIGSAGSEVKVVGIIMST